MKKIYFLSFLLVTTSQIFSQTLFTYGTDAVSKDEFLRAYNKNKTPNTNKAEAYKEYLDLYIKFKLKVKAAKQLRLDTLEQLQTDIDGFRSQVEEGYMNDDKGVNDLVQEAFTRGQKEIHTMHFYVPINATMPRADSITSVKMIETAYAALAKGRTDYAEIAAEISAQYKMVIKAADLGYVTALSVPYEYENIIYGLKPNGISKPYQTKKAWHIFKNLDERKNQGRWKVAQILLVFPPDATAEIKNKIKQKADSIHSLLAAGGDFTEMTKKYNQDRNTFSANGELPEFGTGKFDLPFETAVFALKKDGDISAPILTAHGYHIIKRIKQIPAVTDDKDENFMFELKQKVQQDARINIAKDKFLKDVLVKIKYKRNPLVPDAALYQYADSVIKNKEITKYPISFKPVFTLANKTFTGAHWLTYVNDYIQSNTLSSNETSKDLFKKYLSVTAFDYYRKNLEKYNNDFKYQMQEFKEGNMLFEIMERNVWSKAANDSIGLKKYYDANKAKYLWEESADVIIYNCSDAQSADYATKQLLQGKNWKTIAEESNATIQADSGRYKLSQLPTTTKPAQDLITKPDVNSGDGTASFVQVIKMYPSNQHRSFEEAKGLVINEYQIYLEEKWIETLKKKYPVKIVDAVFKSMIK